MAEKHPPIGYRRDDPDETMGRWLYRRQAEGEARASLPFTLKVKLCADRPALTSGAR